MTIAEKLQTIAENEQKVYDAGVAKGKSLVPDYNEFWDAFQTSINNTEYGYAFAGRGWTNTTFKPKYDIRPGDNAWGGTTSSMFYGTNISGDLVQILDDCGVELDFSKATNFSNTFTYATGITRIGVIDTRNATSLHYTFSHCSRLKTIDLLILKSDGGQTFTNPFISCTALENITIEGVIGNSIDFRDCTKLSGASLLSIVGALSTTTSGYSITLSQTAIDNAIASDLGQFLTSWENLLANRTNWTFVYV